MSELPVAEARGEDEGQEMPQPPSERREGEVAPSQFRDSRPPEHGQPERPQPDEREWKLVAGTERVQASLQDLAEAVKNKTVAPFRTKQRWFIFDAPPVPESETIWLVPKSSYLAAQARIRELEGRDA